MNNGKVVSLRTVTHSFAFLLCLGALLNTVSKYEWAIFRSVDLYSWAPASEATYRYFWGRANFLLNESHFENGISVEDIDGIQVFIQEDLDQDAQEQQTNQLLKDYLAQKAQKSGNNSTALEEDVDSANFQIQDLIVVYYVDNSTPGISLHDYCLRTNQPRVRQQLFKDWRSVYQKIPRKFFRLVTLEDISYLQSKTYWLLIAIPILSLVYNIRLPKTMCATTLSSRQALFRSFPWLLLLGKRYLLDPLSVLYCLLNAEQHHHDGDPRLSFRLTFLDLLAYAYSANANGSYHTTTVISSWISLTIRCIAVVAQTMTVYQIEMAENQRVTSTTEILFPQLVAVAVLSQLYIQFCSSTSGKQHEQQQQSTQNSASKDDLVVNLADIESGLCKYVFSMHFYTAAATKLGQTGLGWIDDRYLVQLALRGRYRDGNPYPLELFMIWMPPLFRALGMVTVIIMQLSAVTSWWKFERHATLWITFIIVSTLSIGVPLRVDTVGPLLQIVDIIGGVLWEYHYWIILLLLLLVPVLISGIWFFKARQREELRHNKSD